ncbi:apolipoprotein D-like [Antedon mediterranea]|uniref:apolipoprotein D-like n=1 Tax=Antedon mediterranea TaxID=105859 RepID=UPI003AF996B9
MCSHVQFVCLLVAGLVGAINGQVFAWGGCPDVTVVKDFNVMPYLGTWYEAARFPTSFEKDARCVTANYTLKDNGHIEVDNSGYFPGEGYNTDIGDAKPNKDPSLAKLGVKFSWWQPRGDYWVLATDYEQYALIHSCTGFFNWFNIQFNWILVRDVTKSVGDISVIDKWVNEFGKQGIDTDKFDYYGHVNCPPRDTTV